MTETEQQRCKRHFETAACRIRSGCKRHLDLVGMDDLILLCRCLNCNITDLLDLFWSEVKHCIASAPPSPLFDGPDD